ncbi:MAG: iron-containing redox enzyme family protein [Myxococcota bacterium]
MTVPQRAWMDGLSEVARERIAGLGSLVTLERGQAVSAGDADLYLVEEGEVESIEAVPRPIGPGEIFGEESFLDGVTQRGVALSYTRARRIPRVEILTAFGVAPGDLRALLDAIARVREERRVDRSPDDTARGYVVRLGQEALRHRAVTHPYLQALGDGALPDLRWALADFAQHYYGYSRHFPRYLTTVMSRLEHPAHRRALLDNLTEESGTYSEEEYGELAAFGVERAWIEGQPHPALFQRFCRAIGAPTHGPEADQVVAWRELFLASLASSAAGGVGALGLGTENIVRTMYGHFVRAIDRVGDLSAEDTVFFPLHTAVDDHHQATLEAIATTFAETEEGRVELRRGMLKALACRSSFWDWLYERACDPEHADEVL